MGKGTCVFEKRDTGSVYGFTKRLRWTCVADANGDVDDPAMSGEGYDGPYYGIILGATITPGAPAPVAGYSVKLQSTERQAVPDLLFGLGAATNLSTTNAVADMPLTEINGSVVDLFGDQLRPLMSGLGAGGQVVLEIVIKP